MANRLAGETSPYLLQHANNPVDWYPWGGDAFAKARGEDKPVLLSVGYSACHWCHVMAHESFENEQIAALMNRFFVNVKVDREERPDVDSIYMQAVQAMSGHGGWPMTVFLDPAGVPFFGGTYFPPEDRGGMRGFRSVLQIVADLWTRRRDDVNHAATEIRRLLESPPLPQGTLPAQADLDSAAMRLVDDTDMELGGFGQAPKFPHPAALDFLLRRFLHGGDPRLWEAASRTLDAMARGGINDQVGGGFHRYSVDSRWTVPHFEKMLYDSAQLIPVYLHAHQLSGRTAYRRVVEQTVEWLLREMRLAGGAFASSQDADSPDGEGAFFVWTPAQLHELLGEQEGELAARIFGVSDAGNFEHGTTVLSMPVPLQDLAAELGVSEDDLAERVDAMREALFKARGDRAAPGRDDKVLTSWNGLMIAALAEAGAALQRPEWIAAAQSAAGFLVTNVRREGVVQRTWKDGEAKITGFLEDVAALGLGLLTLFEADADSRWFHEAMRCAADACSRFRDAGDEWHDTAADAEALLIRPRTLDDNPLPAGRSLVAMLLLRLARITGDEELRRRGEELVAQLSRALVRAPLALGSLACAADLALAPPREVAVSGSRDDPALVELLAVTWERWEPNLVRAAGDDESVPLLQGRVGDPRVLAHLCQNFACRLPVATAQELREQLSTPG